MYFGEWEKSTFFSSFSFLVFLSVKSVVCPSYVMWGKMKGCIGIICENTVFDPVLFSTLRWGANNSSIIRSVQKSFTIATRKKDAREEEKEAGLVIVSASVIPSVLLAILFFFFHEYGVLYILRTCKAEEVKIRLANRIPLPSIEDDSIMIESQTWLSCDRDKADLYRSRLKLTRR